MDLDAALDDLYSRPLDEFTAARNELSKQLADAGDNDAAKELRQRKKPVVAAWAMNQLAHRYPDQLEELFRVATAMAEPSDAAELRNLSQQRNRSIKSLSERAERILEESGHGGGQVAQQISMTLLGATDDAMQRDLRAGRLTQLPNAAGGQWSLASLPEPEVDADDDRSERAAAAERAEQEAIRAERELREHERALADAQAALAGAEKAVERARRAAEAARDSAEELKAKL
ncbi:MAG: hypothetical protein M3161_05930 [Actinomycetota bacterium]|nr:hypothetical protein [Actinomycetota bacterium]